MCVQHPSGSKVVKTDGYSLNLVNELSLLDKSYKASRSIDTNMHFTVIEAFNID